MRLKGNQSLKVDMPSWAKEGIGVRGFKGKENNSQEDGEEEMFAKQMFALPCR